MTNKTYDRIKFAALVIAPILAFFASLVTIWGIPFAAEITATLTAIDTLVGGIVVVAKKIYDDKQEET
jgi:hypothetical protein